MRRHSYLALPSMMVLTVLCAVYAACEPASAGVLMVPVRALALGGMLYALGASALVLWSALRGEGTAVEISRVAQPLMPGVRSALLLSCIAFISMWCMTLADLSGVPLMSSAGISERWENAAESFALTDPARVFYHLGAVNSIALALAAIAWWRYTRQAARQPIPPAPGPKPRLIPGSRVYWAIAVLMTVNLGTYASSGHALSAADRVGASSGLWVHLMGVALWAGGLAALSLLLWGRVPLETAEADNRTEEVASFSESADSHNFDDSSQPARTLISLYSHLALTGALLCVLGGVGSALSHAERLKDIEPGYLILVVLKAVLSLVIIGFGAIYRVRLIPALVTGPEDKNTESDKEYEFAVASPAHLFHRMVILELALMATLSVLGAVLARTDPGTLNTSAHTSYIRQITWYDLPPAITAEHLLTLWRPDYCALALAAAMIVLAVRLWRRDYIFRATAAGLAACIFIYATSGAPAIYGRILYHAALARYTAIFCAGALIAWALMPLYRVWRAKRARGLETTLAVLTAFFGLLPIGTVAWSDSFLISKLLRDFMSYELYTIFTLISGAFFCALCILVRPGIRALICGFHGFGAVILALFGSDEIPVGLKGGEAADGWYRNAYVGVKEYSTFSLSYDVNIGDSLYMGANIIYGVGYVLLAICGLSILQAFYRGFKAPSTPREYSSPLNEEQTRVENQELEEELERIYGQSWDEEEVEPGFARP
ncbi:MAG: CopD family protein [Rothia sp. (in: high G+C Gram-positive bacteria)]|uniref:CopD family protein n=1 Tax=Rothia sp. (in: high G+C Gram-positive bacteria) TaxID=1885016 RepID=UPI0026E02597|nr:CopD family protein [Rothia sp. (in: high G+C Gram-positive bacteria)]MDO5750200.1 CopD family protein [Rothia sp. (in: high G+C Gram-positive bacteria)]